VLVKAGLCLLVELNILYVAVELAELTDIVIISFRCDCFIADKDIVDVFESFDNLPRADKPPSIVIMGGPHQSRVAVANRLLGPDVLPAPRRNVAWCTLQFVDTDCVHNFNTAAVNTLWSWVHSVPLEAVERDSPPQTPVRGADVFSIPVGSAKLEFMQTLPVVQVLMSHPVLRAGGQIVICGDDCCIDTVQFAITDVVPVIIFVVSGDKLSEKVCAAIIVANFVGRSLCKEKVNEAGFV